MEPINLIIKERTADIGGFTVGRILPFRQKRSVGPIVFADHMGPAQLSNSQNLDVAPHPHIGLSTITYLFEGAILHRDSLGSEAEIKPGAVNWMTAGSGIVHSERTPDYLRSTVKQVHGIQIWVALPKAMEECSPGFVHIPSGDIPKWTKGDIAFTLIAGEALGYQSPAPVISRLFLLEINTSKKQVLNLNEALYGECAFSIISGKVKIENSTYNKGQMLVLKDEHIPKMEMEADTKIIVLGGERFPEERFIDWNFVSSSRERIEKAKSDWKNRLFDKVPGDDGYTPLP